MFDTVSVSAGRHNLHAAVDLALEFGLGVELMHFASPDILDGNLLGTASEVKRALADIRGPLSLHGPFFDMSPGSVDERVNEICRMRFNQALHTAAELGAQRMVVHANFIASIRNDFYRRGWHARNVDFWSAFVEVARSYNVVIAVENMWEFDPDIIGDLLKQINHPNLRACLDVGHANLFGSEVAFDNWLSSLSEYIVHTHMNNNDGKIDIHMDFTHGVLDYNEVLPKIRALPNRPTMTLEMDEVEFMKLSLPYLDLVRPYNYELP